VARNGETPTRDWKKELEAVYLIFFMAFILEQRYQWASKLSDGIRGWLRRRDEAFRAEMAERFDLWYAQEDQARNAEIEELERAYGDQ
jgi:hypothetical protein